LEFLEIVVNFGFMLRKTLIDVEMEDFGDEVISAVGLYADDCGTCSAAEECDMTDSESVFDFVDDGLEGQIRGYEMARIIRTVAVQFVAPESPKTSGRTPAALPGRCGGVFSAEI
jgi:hypothetical protein